MAFPRGTTPTITFEVDDQDLDLTRAKNVYVTFQNGTNKITKTGEDLTVGEKTVSVTLAQRETLAFSNGKIKVQINWTYDDGTRWSSECVTYAVSEQLLDKVVE